MPKINTMSPEKDFCGLNGRLVRFVGMVQNILDSEYISTVFLGREVATGRKILVGCKYSDSVESPGVELDAETDFASGTTEERGKLICLPIPGESPWLREAAHLSPSFAKGMRVIVYTYEGIGKDIKLNEAVDFVGILSCGPIKEGEEYMETGEELDNTVRHEEHAPKLHAIAVFKHDDLALQHVGCDPAFLNQLKNDANKTVEGIRGTLALTKTKLRAVLTEMFGGDVLAAEYTILNLISRVHARKEPLTLGNFPLNLSNLPRKESPSSGPAADCSAYLGISTGAANDFARGLHQFFRAILERTCTVEVSLGLLEKTDLVPKKNYDTNEIENPGLQLANQTYLLIDETRLAPGTLSEKGCRNLKALHSIVACQDIFYDFTYQSIEFLTNYPCNICSYSKSIFKESTEVKLQEANWGKMGFDVLSKLTKDDWRDFVQYFVILTLPQITVRISSEVSGKMQSDFVEVRHKEGELLEASGKQRETTADTFHTWIAIARLYALSIGKTNLEFEDYYEARKLEIQRLTRLHKQ